MYQTTHYTKEEIAQMLSIDVAYLQTLEKNYRIKSYNKDGIAMFTDIELEQFKYAYNVSLESTSTKDDKSSEEDNAQNEKTSLLERLQTIKRDLLGILEEM